MASNTPMATARSPSTSATSEAGDRADDEVAELHRQPEERVQRIGQAVDGVEQRVTRQG